MAPEPSGELKLQWIHLAKTVARRAGSLVQTLQDEAHSHTAHEHSLQSLEINEKSNATDLVTRADLASQKLIFDSLRSHPQTRHHRLIGEEDGDVYDALTDEPTWVVDAIDGTTNYVHGVRDYAISIGLVVNHIVQVGVVYAPRNNEMFHAVRGSGAFLNDVPISPSGRTTLTQSLIISEWGYVRDMERVSKMLDVNVRLMAHPVRGVRQLGSGALDICYVGMGRADGTYCGILPDAGDAWKIWDYCAASLVATEAGAVMKNVLGQEFDIEGKSMVCTTPGIMNNLLKVIQQ